MASLSGAQQDRISSYRRRRAPDSQSDSQARPWGDLAGAPRAIESQHAASMRQTYNPTDNRGGPFGRASMDQLPPMMPPTPTPSSARAQQSQDPEAWGPPPASKSGPRTPPPPHHDMDIRSYIFDLELQNRELRKQLETANSNVFPATAALVGGSDDAKREFLTNVLAQVESIVEAHRNKANAEIHKYKTEAEQAKLALDQLRQVIQNEGLDLSLAPSLISFHKKQQRSADLGQGPAPTPLGINFPKEVDDMLHQVAVDILTKLQAVTDRDQLGGTTREAVRTGFQSVILHFTDEIVNATKRQERNLEQLRADLEDSRRQNRSLQLTHESKRVEMATEHSLEMDALRDEIRVLTASTAGTDSLTAAMHEKAFAEYAQLLVEARREGTNLRSELDIEKNKSAEVCLKLKATLEKRRAEFEQELVAKAEEVVSQRDRLIAELEGRLRSREAEFAKREHRDFGAQAGEPLVTMPEKENFVPQILSGMHKGSRVAAQSNEMFERDVWRKTQELLAKYGAQ